MRISSIVLSMSVLSALISCTALGTGQDNARVPLDRLQALSNGQPVTPLPPAFSAQATKGIANDQLAMYLAANVNSAVQLASKLKVLYPCK